MKLVSFFKVLQKIENIFFKYVEIFINIDLYIKYR